MVQIDTFINRVISVAVLVVLAMALGTVTGNLERTQAQSSCGSIDSGFGTLSYTITNTDTTQNNYHIWSRVKSSDGQPSYRLNLSSQSGSLCDQTISGSGPANQWIWVRHTSQLNWGAGDLFVEAAGNKAGVGLDCIVIHSSSSFNPTSAADCNPPELDETNPTISIFSPSSGSELVGVRQVGVDASDNVGVTSVTFSIDGQDVFTDNESPYTYSWDTNSYANGQHTLTVTATDAAGNSASASANYTINNQVPNTAPQAVTGLFATAVDSSLVNLTWNAAVDAEGDALFYRIERSVGGGGFNFLADSSVTNYADNLVTQNTLYTYRVTAYEASTSEGLSSPVSGEASATTPAECRRIEFFDIFAIVVSYRRQTPVPAAGVPFDTNGDGLIDFFEIITPVNHYIRGVCQ